MAMKSTRTLVSSFRKSISLGVSALMTLSLVVGISVGASLTPANAALTACVENGSAQNSIRVSPSHASVFYIDSGVTPRIDASYVGYQVANTTGTPMKGYWVSLTNFVGGQVSLANSADQYMQLPDIAGNETETVYFMLKASASTKVAQSHDVKVFSKRPDSAGASNLYGCTYSFKKVAETIKAAANKPISTTVGAIGAIGETFKVTIEGATGTIGQGNPDVGRILYFTPAAYSSFPTRAFRLEKVALAVTEANAINNNTNYRFYNDKLLVTPSLKPDATAGVSFSVGSAVTTSDTLVGKRRYKNEYTFRILSSAPSTTIAPIAQISSGTQIKHTAIDSSGQGTINASASTVSASILKQINSTSYSSYPVATIGGNSYNEVPYKVTISSTADASTDEIVDTPPSGAIFKSGSAQLKVGAGTATTIADPETLTSESALNPRPLHFIGPFKTTATANNVLTYTLYIPAIAGTYSNTVYAKIGDQQVVASSGVAIPGLTVTVGGDGKVSGSTQTTTTLTPAPLTNPASSIATTSATLNGVIDANGATTTGSFEWSTSPTLATYTSINLGSITGSDPKVQTSSLTGLTTGTTYYFRIVAVSATVRYVGEILSFTTYELAATPTVTTTTPTNITSTGATVNASIDPNLQSITQIEFILSVNSDMSSPLSPFIVYDLTEDGALSTTATTLAGASATDIGRDITGLQTTTTYYYYALITYGSGQTVSGLPTKKSFKTGSTAQEIVFAALDDKPFTDGSFTRSPIATSVKSSDKTSTGLTVSYTSESLDICTVAETGTVITFVSAGFCVITANQAGNTTYAAAEPVTQSFQITPSAPTATTQAASSVAIRSATINGDFTTGGGGSTSISFTYGTDSGLAGATTTSTTNSPSTSNGSRSMNLTGLSPATTYYYRISASNSTSSANGSIVSFTTSPLSSQTITWTTIPGKTYGDTATASATASSGLTTSISSMTTSICTVPGGSTSGATVTILSVGSCVLRASQAGNDTYTAAANVDETFIISAKAITVTADNKTRNAGASQPTFTFTASGLVRSDAISSVTFTFESATASYGPTNTPPSSPTNPSGPYSNTPSVAVFGTGNAANYTITYVAGTYTLSSLTNQVLTWTTIGNKTYGQGATASVVSSQNLTPVTVISLTTSICTVPSSSSSGATVTILGVGECRLRASQAGAGSIGPANDVTETFTVLAAPLTITASSPTGIRAGDAVPTITASYSGFVNSENSSALSTLPTCTTSYTTSSTAGTNETTSCSGAVAANYTISYVSGSFVVGSAPGSTYTITYDLGGGSGTTPTETAKSNGQSFTTAGSGGFSRSGFTFAGWSCNGVTYGASASITMGSANLVCTAQWTQNAASPNSNPGPAKPVKKVGISSLVTIATRPVTAPVKVVTQPTPGATPTPQPSPSAKPEPTKPEPTKPEPTKPEPTPTPTAGTNPAPTTESNNPLKQTSFSGNGIARVNVRNEEITVVAKPGFSGNTVVKVTVENDDEISQITANVTVLPLPPVNPVAKPLSEEKTRITWARSPNAIGYEVKQAGAVICKTTAISCVVPFVVPKTPALEIISLGRDKTVSAPIAAKVSAPPAPVKIIPDIALVINFDTNRYNIDAVDRALIEGFARDVVRYGYKEVDISGHTDSRGGVDNNVLSANRAKASRDYLLTLVPDLKVTVGAFADAISVAPNTTASGMAANRRAEFRVVKY